MRRLLILAAILGCWLAVGFESGAATEQKRISYQQQIAPLLTKYCAGCHSGEDAEAELSLESYADLAKGLEDGPLVLPGEPESSHLIRIVTGAVEPRMPPDDEPRPSDAELTILRAWIEQGAAGPEGEEHSLQRQLITPRLPAASREHRPVTAVAISPTTDQVAVGRFGEVELFDRDGKPQMLLSGFPGKVNAIHFDRDGQLLIVATGIAGLYGQAEVIRLPDGDRLQLVRGHRDTLYDAELSPDGRILATASYDRQILLWDATSGEQLRALTGHNGAVYDLAFHPEGRVLASASGDETVKLWDVATGMRLDTLSQPEGEQYTVTFDPAGERVVAGGADSRVRVWKFVSRESPQINPILYTRFAHEGSVLRVAFAADGNTLVTAGDDRMIRVWDASDFQRSSMLDRQPSSISDLAASSAEPSIVVARFDGSWETLDLVGMTDAVTANAADATADPTEPKTVAARGATTHQAVVAPAVDQPALDQPAVDQPAVEPETEPNDEPASAQKVSLPARVKGVIDAIDRQRPGDADCFRFTANRGEQWVVEVKAARDGSPLDSRIEVLTATGEPIERLLLEAVRDTYLAFRGIDSIRSNEIRLHNWEEIEVNDYLYAAGEVMRLWHYPRGPDSGFILYPGDGKRWTYFGTTGVTHALNEPAYVVVPHPPGTQLVASGLPVFTLYYENDDDPEREWETDSRLQFTAPEDGDYLVRVTDVRGFSGPDYEYELSIRPARPGFDIKLSLSRQQIAPGTGREFSVVADRHDGFDGEIAINIEGLPPGFVATNPVIVAAGQQWTFGTIFAEEDALPPTEENASAARVTATAIIDGQAISKTLEGFGKLELATEPPRTRVTILPIDADSNPAASTQPVVLTIRPGQTISALVKVDRRDDFSGEASFGKHDAGRHLPHGVYVDNIGLNGLLITGDRNEREFFITAARWVNESRRWFHLRADVDGGITTRPVEIQVVK